MRCGYLFILITLLHRAMHFGSFGVNALLKEDSEHRLPMPSLFHSMRAPSVSPGWSGSPLKQPLDGYPIRLGPFASSSIFFCLPHPRAIIEEMKVTDGESEVMVWIDR